MKAEKKSTKKAVKKPAGPSKPLVKTPVVAKKKMAAKVNKAAPAKSPAPEPARKPSRNLKAPGKKVSHVIPPILLEGDRPSATAFSGPGQRYALGPTPPGAHFRMTEDLGQLPESYGTERLLITARDPHWLYASWDLTREQQRKYNGLSAEGHLILRTYINSLDQQPLGEVHVHPESRNWFIHVGKGGTKYIAELGYRARDGRWKGISASRATFTPPDAMAEDVSVEFATIPLDVSFEKLLELVTSAVGESVPLVEAVQQLRTQGHRGLPVIPPPSPREWTPSQAKALAEVVTMDAVRRVWMGSMEITELIRRHLQQETSSAAAAQISLQGKLGASVSSISSPYGVRGQSKGFWFNINAEIVLYGATEPDAKVSIGGREIKLRPDGTFSYRFSLPDGQYDLPLKAVSADAEDQRSAELRFGRHTQYTGQVGTHSQDPTLKAPSADNIT